MAEGQALRSPATEKIGAKSCGESRKMRELFKKVTGLDVKDFELLVSLNVFNEALMKICKELNIKYRSSHQIRFTVATLLFENGIPITQLSTLLGHADTAMTWHYIRKQEPDTQTADIMKSVLG